MLNISRIRFVSVFLIMLLITGCATPISLQTFETTTLGKILTEADSVQDIPHLKTAIDAFCTLGEE